jgi:hypothetical protein
MIRLVLLGADTQILSTLCAACPQGPAGCCVAPPEYDWSDVGRVVASGGRDWLLAQLADRRVAPAPRGLAVKRVKKREQPEQPRLFKCVFHGARGCTIDHALRPSTCNYFVCDDVFRDGGAAEPEARRVHALLRDVYERWDRAIAARIAAAWPEGPPWDAAFLDWLGAETTRLAAADRAMLAPLGASSWALAPPEGSAMIAPMSKITLKLRDLTTGSTSFRELADEEAALAFLRARPNLVEVLGVVFEGLSPEQNARLKAAMRPLDDGEKAAVKRLEDAAERAAEAAAAKREKEAEAARAAHRESLKNADPNRVMEVRYRYDGSINPVDPDDTRPLSDECREAILAWVAERNEWVAGRGQCVGEAKLSVWPGNLPKPGADRVQHGSFVPVSAAAKPAS